MTSYFNEGFGQVINKQVILRKDGDGVYYIKSPDKQGEIRTDIHYYEAKTNAADKILNGRNEAEAVIAGHESIRGVGLPKSLVSAKESSEFYKFPSKNWELSHFFHVQTIGPSVSLQSHTTHIDTSLSRNRTIKLIPLFEEGFGVIIKKHAYITEVNQKLYISADKDFSYSVELNLDDHLFTPCLKKCDEPIIRQALKEKNIIYVEIIGYEYILPRALSDQEIEQNVKHIFFASHATILE